VVFVGHRRALGAVCAASAIASAACGGQSGVNTGPADGGDRGQDVHAPPTSPGVDGAISDGGEGDSGASPGIPAWLGPSSFAACAAGPDVFYAVGEAGSSVLAGPASVTDSVGMWKATLEGDAYLTVDVSLGSPLYPAWAIALNAGFGPFTTGHYVINDSRDDGMPDYFVALVIDGRTCESPTGSFDVYTLDANGASDQAGVNALQASFDLQCGGDGGASGLQGCINYVAPSLPSPPLDAGPLAPCEGSSPDVLYFLGGAFITNTDSIWDVSFEGPSELEISIETNSMPLILEFAAPDGQPLAPATYGPAASTTPVSVFSNGGDVGCLPASSFTIVNLQTEGDAGEVGSLLLYFDCATGQTDTQGCLQYQN
jgi:hypothetical protein